MPGEAVLDKGHNKSTLQGTTLFLIVLDWDLSSQAPAERPHTVIREI